MTAGDDDELTIGGILGMRDAGVEQAALEMDVYERPRQYVLMAYELYPNGTTAGVFEMDPEVAKDIGQRMGIGAPNDPKGWGIWYVPDPGNDRGGQER